MLKDLKVQHREIARLRFENFTPTEISEKLGLNYVSVCKILRDPLCKGYMEGLSDRADTNVINVRKTLSEMNVNALNAMKNILDPLNANVPYTVQASVSKDVLDRNGYKPVEKTQNINMHLTTEDLHQMQERQEKLLNQRSVN